MDRVLIELCLLALVPVLAYLLVRLRTRSTDEAPLETEVLSSHSESLERLSCLDVGQEDMSQFVSGLAAQLEPAPKITAPIWGDQGTHVWKSPTGKRVYIN